NKDDLIVSPNGRFTAGFHQVGENAYVFAVWFTAARTVVWMANRDVPVNGKKTKLSLWKDGNLVLIDAGQHIIWSTQTKSTSSKLELTLNDLDWSRGCEPDQSHLCKKVDDCDFIEMPYTEFYGYDTSFHLNTTLDACKKECLQDSNCKGFNFAPQAGTGLFFCFLKTSLHNGYQMGVYGTMFIKLPKRLVSSFNTTKAIGRSSFSCPQRVVVTPLVRAYEKKNTTKPLGFFMVVGSRHSSVTEQVYFPVSTGFRRFTYSELKKASNNFSEEIGSGGASVVYKARLKDNRIAAIKKLKNSGDQGEDEFQAEISTIGRMNHMNLIETWGYCAEGKHRLVVYEYMENGSLASNLWLDKLDWATRLNIVIGTAKGLAYGVVVLEIITGRSPCRANGEGLHICRHTPHAEYLYPSKSAICCEYSSHQTVEGYDAVVGFQSIAAAAVV
ncbi:hypothetical protein M8C21_033197, partial [Ambrosia artemisiifolia]